MLALLVCFFAGVLFDAAFHRGFVPFDLLAMGVACLWLIVEPNVDRIGRALRARARGTHIRTDYSQIQIPPKSMANALDNEAMQRHYNTMAARMPLKAPYTGLQNRTSAPD